jgi:hypothetical protein
VEPTRADAVRVSTSDLVPEHIDRYEFTGFVAHEMTPAKKAERRKAIVAVNNTCQRCGSVAWSRQFEAGLELRPKCGDPTKMEVVCGECCKIERRQPTIRNPRKRTLNRRKAKRRREA